MSCKNLIITLVGKRGEGDAKDLNYKETVERLMKFLNLEYIMISPQIDYDDQFVFYVILKLGAGDINLDTKPARERLKKCFCGAKSYGMVVQYCKDIGVIISSVIEVDRNPYCYGLTVKEGIKIAEPSLKYDDTDFIFEIFMHKKSWEEACQEEETKYWLKTDEDRIRNLYALSQKKDK